LRGEPLSEKAADPRVLHPVPTTSDNICHIKSIKVKNVSKCFPSKPIYTNTN
jgi:hypothetical protein